ncbi:hypothetical protein DAETH_28340 [Deinococcus aetherius]|uniref:Uncharacterized protein n=1 Tax=Deinococcus aetherius TaxID=200252 RepID=A0ABM8AGE1_9DEIO|nr:hypothetical protein [Deinococcus aetherius]BDP42865.1 hypothetical protein DAETH_28340 [Deinococcus aetherius]
MRRHVLPLLALLALTLALARAAPAGPQPALVLIPGSSQAALLGVWEGRRWLEDGDAARRVRGSEGYRVQALGGQVASARGARAESFGAPCPDAFGVTLSPGPRFPTFAVATPAGARSRPRPVTVLPVTGAVYRAAIRDELVKRGLREPAVNVTRVVRADLDGNGTDEVIVEARRFAEGSGLYPPPSGQPGDYSVLLLRHVVGNRVRTSVLGAYVALRARDPNSTDFGPLATLHALAGIADLNGDGRMEVITFGAYYEGYALTASEWTPGAGLRARLETGCGA